MKPIWPDIEHRTTDFEYNGETWSKIELLSYVRIKSLEDGKWYLARLFQREEVKKSEIFAGRLLQIAVHFNFTAYRYLLFGIVGTLNVTDPTQPESGEYMFTLDEDQYSEHGRFYANDHLMFPKGPEPPPAYGVTPEVHKEFLQLHAEFLAKLK